MSGENLSNNIERGAEVEVSRQSQENMGEASLDSVNTAEEMSAAERQMRQSNQAFYGNEAETQRIEALEQGMRRNKLATRVAVTLGVLGVGAALVTGGLLIRGGKKEAPARNQAGTEESGGEAAAAATEADEMINSLTGAGELDNMGVINATGGVDYDGDGIRDLNADGEERLWEKEFDTEDKARYADKETAWNFFDGSKMLSGGMGARQISLEYMDESRENLTEGALEEFAENTIDATRNNIPSTMLAELTMRGTVMGEQAVVDGKAMDMGEALRNIECTDEESVGLWQSDVTQEMVETLDGSTVVHGQTPEQYISIEINVDKGASEVEMNVTDVDTTKFDDQTKNEARQWVDFQKEDGSLFYDDSEALERFVIAAKGLPEGTVLEIHNDNSGGNQFCAWVVTTPQAQRTTTTQTVTTTTTTTQQQPGGGNPGGNPGGGGGGGGGGGSDAKNAAAIEANMQTHGESTNTVTPMGPGELSERPQQQQPAEQPQQNPAAQSADQSFSETVSTPAQQEAQQSQQQADSTPQQQAPQQSASDAAARFAEEFGGN